MSRQRPEYKEIAHNSSNYTDVSLDTYYSESFKIVAF